MNQKRTIDVEKLKEAITARVNERDEYAKDECLGDIGEQEVFDIIDTLAQPVEPVKTEAIERALSEYLNTLEEVERESRYKVYRKIGREFIKEARAELTAIRRRG